MASKKKIQEACKAMKPLGILKTRVLKKLKELLQLYDNNWGLIEDEGYRALADALMEKSDEIEEEKPKKKAPASSTPPKKFFTRSQKRKDSSIHAPPYQCSSFSSVEYSLQDDEEDVVEIFSDSQSLKPEEFDSLPEKSDLRKKKEIFTFVPDSHKQVATTPLRTASQINIRPSSGSSSESEDIEIPLRRSVRKRQFDQVSTSMDTSQWKLVTTPSRERMVDEAELSQRCNDRVVESIHLPVEAKQTNLEADFPSKHRMYKRRKDLAQSSPALQIIEPSQQCVDKDARSPILLHAAPRTSLVLHMSQNVVPGMNLGYPENVLDCYHNPSLDIVTGSAFSNDQLEDDVPISVIHPEHPQLLCDGSSNKSDSNGEPDGLKSRDTKSDGEDVPLLLCDDDSSEKNDFNDKAYGLKSMDTESTDLEEKGGSFLNSHFDVASCNMAEAKSDLSLTLHKDGALLLEPMDVASGDLEVKGDSSMNSQFDVASSSKGEVKLCLIHEPSLKSDFQVPDFDEVVKVVEDELRKSYRIMEPKFSLRKAMKELCECYLAMSAVFANDEQSPAPTKRISSNVYDATKLSGSSKDACQPNFLISPDLLNGSVKLQNLLELKLQIPKHIAVNWFDCLHSIDGFKIEGVKRVSVTVDNKLKELEFSKSNSCSRQACEEQQLFLDLVKSYTYLDDVSRGEESVKIFFLRGASAEDLPPFAYIAQNVICDKASVKFSFACISDENCCSYCHGDCLTSLIPCVCARDTGGEFAYTPTGLVNEKFLKENVSVHEDPKKDRLFFCSSCPLERSKSNMPGSCKGHLKRKFIKECWSKCGCSKSCGNRIVQRGITRNLQVFWTPEGRGWGLQTIENLPRGAFVCEYIGEILTASELNERNLQSTNNQKNRLHVMLDAAWDSRNVLSDEETLCLDGTQYGNVARFINHRCSDANLIEIPVEVETPNRCYYHLAFFTKREVAAMEELTWDYGIDFKDTEHSMKPFDCLCGSLFCRDQNR